MTKKNYMKLKVCGLNDRENILQMLECKPDYIGFIFYEKSPRFIRGLASDFVKSISSAKKVGVFVNETEERVRKAVADYGLDFVQLHGEESPEFCGRINKIVPVIKAFHINDVFDFSEMNPYEGVCEFFLFDTKSENYGGSGKSFNHLKLEEYKLSKPAFLSGGLDLSITEDMLYLQSIHPNVFAIDVNSRFELSPGIKDAEKIKVLTEKMKRNELHS
jgi:phosphoribosylanthranilate isomerase